MQREEPQLPDSTKTVALHLSTKAVHDGCEPEDITGAVSAPIYMTSTYAQVTPGVDKGYDYTRAGNPNFTRLERQLASLENATYCVVFSAGLAAITAVFSDLVPGDSIVLLTSVYGGTYRLIKRFFEPKHIRVHELIVSDLDNFEDYLLKTKNVKWFMLESPTNPLLDVLDIENLCAIARRYHVLSLVDNTFATSIHQLPLYLGADAVIHSSTKYIGGHSDVLGGVVLTNDKNIYTSIEFYRRCIGLTPSPFDTWLLSRSAKTLPLRMERHSRSAQTLAEFFQKEPYVKKVYYPGLPTHPNHSVACRQMHGGFGGMISVEFDLPLETLKAFVSGFSLFVLAESLGGVESLVSHPATMTHASMDPQIRRNVGISDYLIRFSVGIEAVEDLINDITETYQRVVASPATNASVHNKVADR